MRDPMNTGLRYPSQGMNPEFLSLPRCSAGVLLGIREVYHKRPPRVSMALYGASVVSIILYVATGFEVNFTQHPDIHILGEVFNVMSKTALAFALHIGLKK
jgi:hypothetical protein